MVSDRGRYCSKGVDIFKRMRVNFPVEGSFDNSHIPAQLAGETLTDVSGWLSYNHLTESIAGTILPPHGEVKAPESTRHCSDERARECPQTVRRSPR